MLPGRTYRRLGSYPGTYLPTSTSTLEVRLKAAWSACYYPEKKIGELEEHLYPAGSRRLPLLSGAGVFVCGDVSCRLAGSKLTPYPKSTVPARSLPKARSLVFIF